MFCSCDMNFTTTCFVQSPLDALVKIEITLASTINVPGPLYNY